MSILPSPPPLPIASRTSAAFDYLCDRLRNGPQLAPVVRSWQVTVLPIDFGKIPNARPAVFLAPSEGQTQVIGTGRGNGPTVRTDLHVAIGIAIDGNDPAEALRLWEAIERELFGNYRAHLPELWGRGITAIRPVSAAHAPIRPAPDSKFFVTTGIVSIEL